MSEDPALAPCPTCGAGEAFAVPVWEEMEDYEAGEPPDHIGCTECNTMRSLDTETET